MAFKYQTASRQDPESGAPATVDKSTSCIRWGVAVIALPFLVLAFIQGTFFLNKSLLLVSPTCFENEENDTSAAKEQGWNLHEKSHRESGAGGTCWALQERHLYYPESQHVPSPALLDALREYELRHQRCTVGVLDWALHFSQLQAGYEDCQYIVWRERPEGLGNRFGSLMGAFQYALLTGRVLLLETKLYATDQYVPRTTFAAQAHARPSLFVAPDSHSWHGGTAGRIGGPPLSRSREARQGLAGVEETGVNVGAARAAHAHAPAWALGLPGLSLAWLICNPMPFSSWWLPKDFPSEALKAAPNHGAFLHDDDPNLGKRNMMTVNLPWWLSDDDMKFICDEGQQTISNVTWSIFESNQEKLHTLFPDRRMYTHLIRYLYVPVNSVWERVTRNYDAYFGSADVRVGAQIRTFAPYNPVVSQRVLDCLTSKGALPAPITGEQNTVMLTQARARASSQRKQKPLHQLLFVASMERDYFVDFRRLYTERPAEDGSIVAVFAEAAEGGENHHVDANHRAMVDQLLLSMSDVLLISYASSFGHVVNGLAGHNNTFFMNICENSGYTKASQFKYNNRTVCERVWGQESCNGFQQNLPCNNWQKYGTTDPRKWLGHVVACQDMQQGLSLVPIYE
eukprot:jgi/Mesen1/8227/ME000443S07375